MIKLVYMPTSNNQETKQNIAGDTAHLQQQQAEKVCFDWRSFEVVCEQQCRGRIADESWMRDCLAGPSINPRILNSRPFRCLLVMTISFTEDL